MKNIKFYLLILFACMILNKSNAQTFFEKKRYPTNQFRNPLDIPLSLVGNFGECRPNHFHSGIDIRTEKKENLLVYAVDDGYISRVKIEAGGFGNAIYISHAGGYTTVYAHLNKFFPTLESHIRKKQYEQKSWKTDISFMPYEFVVKKGTVIARSGNTGSSQGPHLHFEIRNTKTEAPLNPLLFYNINDLQKPVIKQLAIYDGSKSIYEQSPIMMSSKNITADTLKLKTSKVYFGIVADDFMQIATGTLGIYEMRLYVNDEPYFAWQMDDISYDITRYMNAHADYKTKKNKGPWIQLCTKLPNDQLKIYNSYSKKNGTIDLSDGIEKKIRIEVYDTKYNMSSVNFTIQGISDEAIKNTSDEMIAGKKNKFENKYCSFTLDEHALYDNIFFKSSVTASENPYSYLYQIHNGAVPLHKLCELSLTPKIPIQDALKNKIALVKHPYLDEKNKKGIAAKYLSNKVTANIKEFGNYEIMIDQMPPVITTTIKDGLNISKSSKIFFHIKEETTSVKKVEAKINGQWIRIAQKGNTYYYELDEYCPNGEFILTITASDENDNSITKSFKLIK